MAQLARRRSHFLRSLEEDIIVRRKRSQRRSDETEFIYPIGEAPIKAIIRPARHTTDTETIVALNFDYICNITPIRPEIRLNDQIVRFAGKPHEQVLIVTFVDPVEKILRLELRDRDRTIE